MQCIHEILQSDPTVYDQRMGKERCLNATDIKERLADVEIFDKEYTTQTIKADIRFMREKWNMPIKYDDKRHGYRYTRRVAKLPFMSANEGDLFGLLVLSEYLKQLKGTPLYSRLSATLDKLTIQMAEESSFIGPAEMRPYNSGYHPLYPVSP